MFKFILIVLKKHICYRLRLDNIVVIRLKIFVNLTHKHKLLYNVFPNLR